MTEAGEMAKEVKAKVDMFPSMPWAAARLLCLLDQEDTTAAQVESVLRNDPGLTGNILKLVNSAYFGIPSKIASIRQAAVLLGWKRLYQITTMVCSKAFMDKPVPGYDLGAEELWRHSISVSVAAEMLANKIEASEVEQIFTAGLLHDLGKLIMGTFVKEELEAIEKMASQGVPFEIAERAVLGTDHAEIGAMILERWALPEKIVEAVRWHHDPESAGVQDEMLDLIHIADLLCLMMGMGLGVDELQYQTSALAMERLGLREYDLEEVSSKMLEWIKEFSENIVF